MAYSGATPTSVPLSGDDLSDGSISEAKLADDAVSLAKMKAGVDGTIISYDASTNPVAIATGSDGQVLTSAGAGAPPTMKAASHSLVASSTVSGSDVTSFSITGLDLDAHISYFMELELKGAENNFVSIFANNLQTATDYYQQNNYAVGTSSAGEVANTARITYTHPDLFTLSTIDISYVTGRYFAAIANNHRQTASTTFASEIQCVRKTVELAANLTRLDIVHNGSGGIAVGSKMRLYKRV